MPVTLPVMETLDVKEIRRRNIASLIERHGGPTKFGKDIDRDQSQVSQWLGGKSIGSNLAREIEAKLALPRGWLDQPQWARAPVPAYEVRAVDGNDGIDHERETQVAEVDVRVSGGPGAWVPEYVETQFRMVYQLYWFRQRGAKPENVRLMKVRGNSMEPVLWDGDKIAVDLAARDIVDDRVYAIVVGGLAKVKRLFRMADGRLRIVSDNADKSRYPDEFVGPEDIDSVYVIGRVIDKSGSGGL